MAKLTLDDLANLSSEVSAVDTINDNSDAVETAFENTLSRDGTSPNTMEADLDMNSNRILNLPAPVAVTEPLRVMDVDADGNVTINNSSASLIPFTPAGTIAASNVQDAIEEVASEAQLSLSVFNVKDYGAVGDGATNDTTAVQAAITAAAVSGGIVWFPQGTYSVADTLTLQSKVYLVGASRRASIIKSSDNPVVTQVAATQLAGAGLLNLGFLANGNTTADVLSFFSHQNCTFHDLAFTGFTDAKILKIAGATVSSYTETVSYLQTSNIICNSYKNWFADGCAYGVQIKGHYGAVPTASPANSSNVPDLVHTADRFENLFFTSVTTKGLDLIGATDTNYFSQITLVMSGANSIGLDLASDAVYTGNNYCNSNVFKDIVFAITGAPSGVTYIKSGWTFGNQIDYISDTDFASVTSLDVGDMVSGVIVGRALESTISNTLMGHNLYGTYFRSRTTTGGLGYGPGAGGTVTQATSKSTTVVLDAASGDITMNNANLAADNGVSFTLTNSSIEAEDQLVLSHHSGGSITAYLLNAQCGTGGATITVRNISTAPLAEAIVIRFNLIKGAQT